MKIENLIIEAKKARDFAYAPFSGLKIGAAILTEDEKIYTGCNVENSSFGLTMCAERVAVFKAISEGNCKLKALAIVGDDTKALIPCGACLQVLSEFARKVKIIISDPKGNYHLATLSQLLPRGFKLRGRRPRGAGKDTAF